MDLSIIVVSYNTRALVEDCLASVERHLEGKIDYESIVVDNASRDGTPAWLEAHARAHPRVRPILSPDNLGFSGGNNLGIRVARGRHVLFLNSDAYLVDDSVLRGIAYLEAHPDVFSVAALLLTGDGRPGPSYGHFPGPATVARELLTKRFNQLRAACPVPGEGTHDVDFPCGAYILAPAAKLAELGPMDDGFFMYFEETDLARRARDRGWRNVYLAEAKAVHLGGGSSGEGVVGNYPLARAYYASWRRYLGKHHGIGSQAAVKAMLLAYYGAAGRSHASRGNARMAEFFRTHARAVREGWVADASAPPK